MSLHVYSFEATTFLSVEDPDDILDQTSQYAFGPTEGTALIAGLRSEGKDIPSWVVGVLEAYATGERDDLDDGELKTFVRVSVLVDVADPEEEIEISDILLEGAYDRLGLPDSMDGGFEFSDDETLDEFLACKSQFKAEVEAIVANRATLVAPAP